MAFTRDDLAVAKAVYDSDPERWEHMESTPGLRRAYESLRASEQPQAEYPEDRAATPAAHSAEQTEPLEPVEEVQQDVLEEEEESPVQRHHDGRHMSTTPYADSSVSSVSREEIQSGSRRRAHRMESVATITSVQMEDKLMAYLDRHPTAMQRMEEHRLQHSQTVGSRKSGPLKLPNFGGNKPYPPPLPEREVYVVEFDGHDDPKHAQNWPLRKKLIISSILILDAFAATFASAVFAVAAPAVGVEFHKGREVTTLGTSLFVLGYACGPIIFAPMSELYGRRVPIIIAAFAFGIFNIAVAVAKDYQTLMLCRFFAGIMGAAPLTIVAAVFADMFSNEVRGVAVACFSATIFNGPLMAPFIGGFITKSYLGWRWTAYIPAFIGFAACILSFFFQDETYGPVILVSKASELRRLTRNWGIHAKQEEVEVDLKELLSKNLSRPLRILFTEPIVLLVTIYMSFIYGLLYLSLTAYGLVFGQVYGWSLGVSGLPYFGMIIGIMMGFLAIVLMNPGYVRKLKANNNVPVPEWRLPLTMVGGIIFSAGLFWFGWGGYMKSTPWIVPTLAGLFMGFGIYAIFLQCLNYVIDAYLIYAASAIAANTIMRSIFGAVFPLFGYYMFEGIGINWGMTLLGCVAALFIPMPFILYYKGKSIRAKSKFAPAPDIAQDKRRDDEARMAGDAAEVQRERENQRVGKRLGDDSGEQGLGEKLGMGESEGTSGGSLGEDGKERKLD